MAEAEAWVMIPKLDEKKTGCVLEMKPLVLCKTARIRDRLFIKKTAQISQCAGIKGMEYIIRLTGSVLTGKNTAKAIEGGKQ